MIKQYQGCHSSQCAALPIKEISVKRRRLPRDLPVISILAEKVRTTHIHSVASNSLIAAQSVVALTSDAINEAINTIQNSNVSGII